MPSLSRRVSRGQDNLDLEHVNIFGGCLFVSLCDNITSHTSDRFFLLAIGWSLEFVMQVIRKQARDRKCLVTAF